MGAVDAATLPNRRSLSFHQPIPASDSLPFDLFQGITDSTADLGEFPWPENDEGEPCSTKPFKSLLKHHQLGLHLLHHLARIVQDLVSIGPRLNGAKLPKGGVDCSNSYLEVPDNASDQKLRGIHLDQPIVNRPEFCGASNVDIHQATGYLPEATRVGRVGQNGLVVTRVASWETRTPTSFCSAFSRSGLPM